MQDKTKRTPNEREGAFDEDRREREEWEGVYMVVVVVVV
jgi:hypothetical protein